MRTIAEEDMTRRGGYAKGALSKEVILDCAVELFGRNGYQATSLRDVARHSGLTHSGLLHHFPNKVALLMAVLERKDKLDHERSAGQQRTEMLSMDAFMDLIAKGQQRPEITRLFTMLAAEATNPQHPVSDYFVERYRVVCGIMAGIMQSSQGAGLMRSDVDPELTARMMIAMMDGMQLQWLLEQGRGEVEVDMTAVLDQFFKLLHTTADALGEMVPQEEDPTVLGH